MPLYMDIHTVDSDAFTVEDVVKAHMQDLAIQESFGVIQIKYWVNVEAKTLFCLMEGPNKEACNEVHKQSHGNTACNIIEVFDDEYNLYLGEGKSVKDLAHTNSGEIDTGYRTILLLSTTDFTGQYSYLNNEIHKLIKQHYGVSVMQPDKDFLLSFVYASNAVLCALAIRKLLQSIPDHFEFALTLVSGRPVDEHGDNLFEETKKKAQCVCMLGRKNTLYIDSETKNLSEKEPISPNIRPEDFYILHKEDFIFLFQLYELLKEKVHQSDFKSENLQKLLGLSKSQTYRKIKSLTGTAPNQLIQEMRLSNSLKSLQNNNRSIAEIAYEVGFSSPTYFARVFRNRFGLTPTHFTEISKSR